MKLQTQKPTEIKLISVFYLLLSFVYCIFFIKMFSGHVIFLGIIGLILLLLILGILFINLLIFIRIIKGKNFKGIILGASFLNLLILLFSAQGIFYLSAFENFDTTIILLSNLAIIFIFWQLHYLFFRKNMESQDRAFKEKIIIILLILMVLVGFVYSYSSQKKLDKYYEKVKEETLKNNEQVEKEYQKEYQKIANANKLLEEKIGMKLSRQYGVPTVTNIINGSHADKSGIKINNNIIKINNIDIYSIESEGDDAVINLILEKFLNKEKISLTLTEKFNNGETFEVELK